MGFKCGIVGLPNVGKSTLFNALTETAAAQAANYPFCTIEPNVGEVAVPDPRLDALAKLAKSVEIVPTRLTFVDIAGLVRGASKGEGLGNQFLANIREVDAIAHVVRCFEDDDVTHVENRIDPVADIETIETELMLADLDSLEQRVDALEKKAKGNDKEAKARRRSISSTARWCCCARASRRGWSSASPRRRRLFHSLGLLTSMPVLYVCNVDEASAATGNAFSRKVEARAKAEGAGCVVISAKIEAEIAVLSREERAEYLGAVGLDGARPRPADPRRLRAARPRHLFHRRAEGGAGLDHDARHQAPQAAGVIHTDFERGFIRAETIAYRRLRDARRRSRRARRRQDAARRQGLRGRRRRRDALQVRDVALVPATDHSPEAKRSAPRHTLPACYISPAVADGAEMLVDPEHDQHEFRDDAREDHADQHRRSGCR